MKKQLLFIVFIIFVTGCKTEDKTVLFETKDKAINFFVQEQSVEGSILELDLGEVETVLLFQQMKDVYYLGEVAKIKEKYSSFRNSPGVDIGNTTGAMWAFKTYKGNEYAIKISKEKEDINSIYNKDFGLFVSVVKGKRTYEERNVKNIIKSNEIIKIQ
jgi:hypothetical protein